MKSIFMSEWMHWQVSFLRVKHELILRIKIAFMQLKAIPAEIVQVLNV